METKNIINELWEYMDEHKDKNKIHGKVFDWLNRDNLYGIMIDDKIFYFERPACHNIMPNYVYNWLIKWVQKKHKNLTYLYSLTP